MIVQKFGGTSVGAPDPIRNVFKIVNAHLDQQPIVVVSAVGGVTDLLLNAAQDALKGIVDTTAIRAKHQLIIDELGLEQGLIDKEHSELEGLLTGIKMLKLLRPKSSDMLVSFGERISCQLVSAYFRTQGVASKPHFAYDIGMITDEVFQEASPLESTPAAIKSHLKNIDYVPVVTGFVGKSEQGEITTLGRGGSDYTAAIIGSAVGASEIQIWTDVDGILTTDPRVVKAARNVPLVSFQEAAELAYFGAKVLHPKTIRPAMDKGIPVVVKNTHNMDHPGTRIVKGSWKSPGTVKALSVKKGVTLVHIYSLRMLDAFGFMSKIFNLFEAHKAVVDMVATSEVSVSVTIDSDENIDKIEEELSKFAEVRVEHDKAIVCVVGEGLNSDFAIPGKVFKAVATMGINPQMISRGASDINLSFVIEDAQSNGALGALHALFFES